MNNRIKFLDGFRGLAILLVFSFHVFSRWTNLVPYKNKFSNIFIFNNGWSGVYLFFLISGFVILMTLERNENFIQFIKKRWLRLFPAMLISVALIFFTASFFYERPNGIPKIVDAVSGLTFVEPIVYNTFFKMNLNVFEGAFWSIFVEVKYYFIFGALYFYKGKHKAIGILFSMFLFYNALYYFNLKYPYYNLKLIELILYKLGFSYYGWFVAGSLSYLYFTEKKQKWFFLSLFAAIIDVFFMKDNISTSFFLILIFLIFIGTIQFDLLKKIISNRVFIFFGMISYPFYLIHENMSIAIIIKMNKFFPIFPSFILPIIALISISLLGYVIVKYFEPYLHKIIKLVIFKNNM